MKTAIRDILLILLLLVVASAPTNIYAQTDTIRYVRVSGAYGNNGRSWATATNSVQDAINDLRDYIRQNNLQSGSVYIAEGTYIPSESTETTGGSMLNTSFKIYEGIHVFGGFNEADPESRPGLRKMMNGKTVDDNWNSRLSIGAASDQQVSEMWNLKYKTILSGNHSTIPVTITFDSIRGRYNTTFPANSYHVVWFATNGEIPVTNDSLAHHYMPLERKAWIDGCTIYGGNASSRQTNIRAHAGYGGGAYMVANSELRNCIISHCAATMRGGGVYMDGGGRMEFCYVHTCEASGVGIVQGYGGAVCIDYDGSVEHSYLTQSCARIGGGLAICHVPGEYPWRERIRARYNREPVPEDEISKFSPFSSASVITNNTTNAEGGGIYLDEGGVLNHCSVMNNNCIGPDVMYYGRRHGRSGGVYIRNCGMLYNSVFWGNTCKVNNNVQFASVKQHNAGSDEVLVYHCAFMNHDITDWTNVQKDMVFHLERDNMPRAGVHANYPCFHHPTPKSGVLTLDASRENDIYPNVDPDSYWPVRWWHPGIYSALAEKGVQVTDAMQGASQWIRHAHTDFGVVGNTFEPVSSLGALIRENENVHYSLVVPQALEYRKGETTPIPTIFVDPNRIGLFDNSGQYIIPQSTGQSWDEPLRNIGDAIMYMRQHIVEEPNNAIGHRAHYRLPSAWDENDRPIAYTEYDHVQILVKEGELTTAGPNNYLSNEMRTASIRMLSHMRLYGGYPKSLTGTNTDVRDPLNLATKITANVLGAVGHDAYENNAAHVLTYVNAEYAIVDGFKLYNGNAHNLGTTASVQAGGGVIVNNETTDATMRIDMVGNELRNCRLANNSAPKGSAIYVNGEYKKRTGIIWGDVCYAELTVINCIIRNNTSDYVSSESTVTESHGVVTANGRAFIDMDHCDIVNNVGYAFKADNKTTRSNTDMPYHGFIRVDNSLIFCNGDRILDDRGNLGSMANVLSVNRDGQDYVFGTYNMFDEDLLLHRESDQQPRGFFKEGFTVPNRSGTLPTGMPDAIHHPLNLNMPSTQEEKQNKCVFTRSDRSQPTYPVFLNPARNVGHSYSGDKPLFGGTISYFPLNTNPCVNAASLSEYGGNNIPRSDIEDYDLSDRNRRNYGGEPDIGAIEDTNLPLGGSVIYVTPDGAGKRDGSSWDNAIAGNTVYVLDDIAGPALATGDHIDTEATCDRILDSENNPILTTNEKYNGGFAKVWLTDKTESLTTTSTIDAIITETNIYTGNGPNDRTETGSPYHDIYSEVTTISSGAASGFVPGYDYDTRYPYGEISGASRSFWRANPYHDEATWQGHYTYDKNNVLGFINDCRNNGWINNTRAERYVSGLQYAVEQASIINTTENKDSVQVWVGAGVYTDYKGYVMRDKVTVLGGFPKGKYSAPGMSERQALMSNVVNIPKAEAAENYTPADYESILQISDINPNQESTHLINVNAVKYWDDDYAVDFVSDTETTETATIARTNTYTWSERTTDVSKTYFRYPDMIYSGTTNVFQKKYRNKVDKDGNTVSNNITMGDEVFGGITWTSGQKVVYQFFGPQISAANPWPNAQGNKSWELAYEDRTNNIDFNTWGFDTQTDVLDANGTTIATVPRGMLLQGVMNTMSIWQTAKNVPAGTYKLQIDLGAYYANDVNESNTGITFYVIASDGNTLVEQPVYCKNDKLRRYTFSFVQPADGDLTIRMMSSPGTKAVDPATGSLGNNNDATKANFRRVRMANVQLNLIVGQDYVLSNSTDAKTVSGTSEPQERTFSNYTRQNHRSSLRKRVLTMPDVCVPTYGAGGIGDPTDWGTAYNSDALPHTDRVWGPTQAKRTAATLAVQEDPNYVEYQDANWDGFTVRHGFIYNESMAHGGGAGVNMYEGAHLRNSIVINNFAGSRNMKGGGIFCDGATSTIEGCFVLNNTATKGTNVRQDQIFAGGMFMYEGTCFNSLFANNYSYGSAGGVGFCVGRFFNNTIAYNTADLYENGAINGGAISLATASNPNLFVANTIVYGNNGRAFRERTESQYQGAHLINPFLHCYIQTEVPFAQNTYLKNIVNHVDDNTCFGIGNILLTGAPSEENTPFEADIENSVYTGNSKNTNDFRLHMTTTCINHGTDDFAGKFYTALRQKGRSDSQIRNSFVYQSVEEAVLPQNDVVFADRVQDCQIDIGAYEFNGAMLIRPDTVTHPGIAIFYVAFDSYGGNASADSRLNPACAKKLQQVLDAAGRYKQTLMTEDRYANVAATPVEGQPDKSWLVQVRLEGDSEGTLDANSTPQTYSPTRSTKHSQDNYSDNPLDYSFIVPHGVQVLGGYSIDFYHEDPDTHEIIDERDPLTFRTIFSGITQSITGAEGNSYHVVTFTNDLFDYNQKLFKGRENGVDVTYTGQLAHLTDEHDRAVLDGIFVQDGYANSPDSEDQYGGAAVVPEYAHIRNCVIQNNSAIGYGGGLYLKPAALISGTIIKNNSSSVGGGVYVEQPDGDVSSETYARILASTICHNTASTRAGGLWFDSNLRANSSVFWKNESNDYANVAGKFTSAEIAASADYPFSFCGVEVRLIEGNGNIELSASETEGVRWDRQDPFDAQMYYPIEMSSTLARAGMNYVEWRNLMNHYTTLDSVDISGVSRLAWDIPGVQRPYYWTDTLAVKDNDFIEIGARVCNRSFVIKPDLTHALYRLFVVRTEVLQSDAARALQDNTNTDDMSLLYRQMGSSFLNPFHRLGDAFSYIIDLRKKDSQYRNKRFEVFLEKGEYTPFRNAHGEEDQVRTNTFSIPEGVTVIGGVSAADEGHNFCQEGYFDKYNMDTPINNCEVGEKTLTITTHTGATYTLNYATTDSIKEGRRMLDYNQNSVIEPWEFERQSLLSGNVQQNDVNTHVYHVITCFADSLQLGSLPIKYRDFNPVTNRFSNPIPVDRPDQFSEECIDSEVARSIVLDGVKIQCGYANNLDIVDAEGHPYQKKTYFRGGGIFVDGNWTRDFDVNDGTIPNVTEPAQYNIPLVVSRCQFNDNMAANGGAIYSNGHLHIFSSHFTQNYAQGPMSELDQSLIPWSAGGAIATNSYCGLTNCLFDNNEAKRGTFPIVIDAESEEYIEDADTRQGFAGVVSAARQSRVRAMNCHFVKNKAVAYPAIFNFKSNSVYFENDPAIGPDSLHLAINSIFWGNEATGIERTNARDSVKQVFRDKYAYQPDGVMYYDKNELQQYRTLYNEYMEARDINWQSDVCIQKITALRGLANRMEGVYFSAYEDGRGLPAVKPAHEMFITPTEAGDMIEFRGMPVPLKPNGEVDLENLFSLLRGNHNVIVDNNNSATNGLHFVQPSIDAGIDGYMDNADWLMSRLNVTTDQGWGCMKQKVTRNIAWWEISTENTSGAPTHYADSLAAAADVAYLHEHGDPSAFTFPVYQTDTALFLLPTEQPAIYNQRATLWNNRYSEVFVPVDAQHYMSYTREGDSGTNEMLRISSYPKHGEDSVFIDMGIYEYQYVQLKVPGSEIDTMWVTATPKPGIVCDGTTWERATDRLQDCIDILLRSYNNHDKYICILGGNYSPQTLFNNRYTFMANMLSDDRTALYLPDDAQNDKDYYVSSLSFLGGWSTVSKEEGRDPEKYTTVLEMRGNAAAETLNQIFVIEDMTRHFMQRTFRASDFRRDTTVIPVMFDGITFSNVHSTQDLGSDGNAAKLNENGGAAIYYRFQRQYHIEDGVETPDMSRPLYPRREAIVAGSDSIYLPKLTISNCIFMDNGKRTDDPHFRSSAVRIDHGGGESLIVNSLFHSNAGAPVFAPLPPNINSAPQLQETPNKVTIVNSTFALNDGHTTLGYDGSEMHNSLIWKDDALNDTLTQMEIGAVSYDAGSAQTSNANITNNAVYGLFENDANGNDPLEDDNKDVYTGPNFVSPNTAASTSEERQLRDFHINPSVRTMNMADSTLYKNKVFVRQYPKLNNSYLWRRAMGFKGDTIRSIEQDFDLAGKSRLHGAGVERGAYECQAVLQRVLYVQPTKPAAMAGDGSSWQKALGQGQLQNAIDVASVYSYLNHAADLESRKSYVFVKGSYDAAPENIIARDGVSVYGSIPQNFTDTVLLNAVQQAYSNAECQRYINEINAVRQGIASPVATPTRANSLNSTSNDMETGFVLDGFVFTNTGRTLTSSPIMMNSLNTVLKNTLITDNAVTGAPVVDLRKGLLYNALLYDNNAPASVAVGAGGAVLNTTVIASVTGQTAIDASNATAGSVVNTITLNIADSTLARTGSAFRDCNTVTSMFARYLNTGNTYTLPAYLTNTKQLHYQLHERSQLINTGLETARFGVADSAANDALVSNVFADYASYINYGLDRDVLGNPRRIGRVDIGAMETWKVLAGNTVHATNVTNAYSGDNPEVTEADLALKRNGYTLNYGGNMYPHTGSVVYVMNGANLVVDHDTDGSDIVPLFDNEHPLRPGYLFLDNGASLYGQGNYIKAQYLSANLRFRDQQFALLSLPFNYSKDNITVFSSYDTISDVLQQRGNSLPMNMYYYDGERRAAYNYRFATDLSECWRPLTTDPQATQGYLLDFGERMADTTLRVNSWAEISGQYVYEEGGDYKTVTLTQYDNRTAGDNGGTLNFTRAEDMGWNIKGQPYLVADYNTAHPQGFTYAMDMPHLFYLMNGQTGLYTDAMQGDQILTKQSWVSGTTIPKGAAYLMQTATLNATEDLVFHVPVFANAPHHSPHRHQLMLRPLGSESFGVNAASDAVRTTSPAMPKGDIVELYPDEDVEKEVNYSLGRDGIKWAISKDITTISLLNTSRTTALSLLGAAPTETDIPLGINIGGEQQFYTFSLPDPQAYEDYGYVWLIDRAQNRTINLLDKDYTVLLPHGTDNSRFAVRIGGYPSVKNGQRQYLIFAHGGLLNIRNLISGDKISVYSTTGKLIHRATATDTEYQTPLYVTGNYFVRVNDTTQQVLNVR